jgi:two-component system CheB/CheR fusion protein
MNKPDHPWPSILRLVAHQMRMPTSLIAGYLEMLATDEIQRNPPRRRQILAQVRESIRDLNRLALELEEASRSASGALPIRRRRMAVDSLIEETLLAAVPLCEYRKVELQFSEPAVHRNMIGDRYYLKLSLLNLIDNAAKYGKPGGHVQVVTKPLGSSLEMRVVDEGSGLGPNAVSMFSPFVREARGPGDHQGIGLGLTLVKAIVEAHGGSMTWRSGRPSYVGFKIPLSPN